MTVNSDGMAGSSQLWSGWTAPSTRLEARDKMAEVTCDLVNEFSPVLPADAVIWQVSVARDRLLSAGVRAGLPEAVEAMVRATLRKQLKERPAGRRKLRSP